MPGMMPLLIAALIAGLAMHSRDLPTPLPLWPHLTAVVGGSLVAWTLICLVMRSVLLRRARGRSLMQWEMLAQGLMLTWFAWTCLGLGWAASLPVTLVALSPYVVMAVVQWACLAAPIARITGERWSAGSNTRMRAMRLRKFNSFCGLVPASSSFSRKSSRKSGFSTFRILGTLV